MNFCEGSLCPTINSSKPGGDGREVQNLISSDAVTRQRGFMAEYFISPPLDITIEFSVPIDISHIKLQAKLDHMCSCFFGVFTEPLVITPGVKPNFICPYSPPSEDKFTSLNQPNPVSSSHASKSLDVEEQTRKNFNTTSIFHENREANSGDEIYLAVGKFRTNGESSVVLKNPHYKHWMKTAMPRPEDGCQGSSLYTGNLRHPNRQALRNVKSLIIRILHTTDKGPPVLGALEVWGQPGINTDIKKRKELLQVWSNCKKVQNSIPAVPRLYNSAVVEEAKAVNNPTAAVGTPDELEVPEDFLDPLTCDIMTVPLLLPSGHSIDAHTLDRFIANEAIWGRAPSDPFTGVAFKQMMKPTPNVPLKARIDRFLLLHSDHAEVKSCGRTVGAAHFYSQATLTTLVEDGEFPCGSSKRLKTGTKQTNTNNESPGGSNVDLSSSDKPEWSPASVSDRKSIGGDGKNDKITENKHALPTVSSLVSEHRRNSKQSSSRLGHSRVLAASVSAGSHSRYSSLLSKSSSSAGHHGLVQMIGGALSMTQGRAVLAKRVPVHRVNDKPAKIISGDTKLPGFDLPSSGCACSCGEKEHLYKFPCEDVVCRGCLLKDQAGMSQVQCRTCQKFFQRSQVVKNHAKSIFSTLS